MRTNLIKSHAYSFLPCHSVNFDPSLSHPSSPLVRRACTCFSTALSTAKLGIIGASTDRLARHIAQEGASLCHMLIRSNETFRGNPRFSRSSATHTLRRNYVRMGYPSGQMRCETVHVPRIMDTSVLPLQDITASRIVNVRRHISSKWCSDPDMGQIISSSKLLKCSFNIFLGDTFCFSLRRLRLGPSEEGEDNSCTTLVDLTSGPGIGDE